MPNTARNAKGFTGNGVAQRAALVAHQAGTEGLQCPQHAHQQAVSVSQRLMDIHARVAAFQAGERERKELLALLQGIHDVVVSEQRPCPVRLELPADTLPVMIEGDVTRLEQIIWNLLSNAVKFTPERGTIRVALWSGEEQGLIGSQAYVAKHFGRFPEPTDPAQKALPASLREPTGALQKTRDYGKFQVYFNMDNGSGRFRGIYAQENLAAMPVQFDKNVISLSFPMSRPLENKSRFLT